MKHVYSRHLRKSLGRHLNRDRREEVVTEVRSMLNRLCTKIRAQQQAELACRLSCHETYTKCMHGDTSLCGRHTDWMRYFDTLSFEEALLERSTLDEIETCATCQNQRKCISTEACVLNCPTQSTTDDIVRLSTLLSHVVLIGADWIVHVIKYTLAEHNLYTTAQIMEWVLLSTEYEYIHVDMGSAT
jgi:ferredoxin